MFGHHRICAVATGSNARDLGKALASGLRRSRTIELRLDWLENEQEIVRFLSWLRKRKIRGTLIATCRRRQAGGKFAGDIATQLAILRLAGECGCAWCDLEIETAEKLNPVTLKELLGGLRRITSFHDFRGTPKNLRGIMGRLERTEGKVAKIATRCRSFRDCERVLSLARKSRHAIAVPMGEIGAPARVLALRERSSLAYASVDATTAPGQISVEEMKELYRADRLSRRTNIYGVIGNPVAHSLGPLLHNTAFRNRRLNAVYLPFLVRDLRDFLDVIGPWGVSGFSVTVPHKEVILRHLDDCDPLASQIGAVNTVVVRAGGRLYGYNTDYVGVLRAMERHMTLRGSRVLLVGAGGAARATAFALAQGGAAVAITARRMARAKVLARAVRGEALERRRVRGEFFDAIVNATPVGMFPHAAGSPLEARELNCRLVMDLVYRPIKTRMLQLAERRGIETISGVEMFLAQGAAQYEIWTGMRAPEGVMRRAVLGALRREVGARNR